MTHRLLQLTILILLIAGSCLDALGQSNTDSLKSLTTCKVHGELKIKEITRRKSKESFREVTMGNDKQKVSVVDGYRVMFAYPDLPYYFANVKIEQSSPESYEKDKEIVVNELKYYATTTQTTRMIFSDKVTLNGFEHYGLDRDKIDVGGQVGIHVLFYDPKQLVITIYFLNQSKAVFANKRRFESIKDYQELRDDFLNSYSECLKKAADTP